MKGSYSVKRVFEIASHYGYKTRVIKVGRTACVVAFRPFFWSPYPDRIESDLASYNYVKRMFSYYGNL